MNQIMQNLAVLVVGRGAVVAISSVGDAPAEATQETSRSSQGRSNSAAAVNQHVVAKGCQSFKLSDEIVGGTVWSGDQNKGFKIKTKLWHYRVHENW